MNSNKSSKQGNKNNSEDSFLKCWKRNKSKIAVISVIISVTIGFNLFLYQWVITPVAEKRVSEAEIEFFKNTKELKEHYEEQVENLKNIINNKENELQSLKLKLTELQNQGVDQREIELLRKEIVLKEKEMKFYKDQAAYLKEQLTKAKQFHETLKKSEIVIETIILRSQPTSLTADDVKFMLKKYDFFCQEQEYDWNNDFCNPNGKGFDNAFLLQKDGQIVYDHKSGLIWQKGGPDNMSFKNAKEWAEQLDFAGFNDWRLPTLEEAMSLMEPEKKNGRYIDPIFDSKQYRIWTSDQYKVQGESQAAWVVYFTIGDCGYGLYFNSSKYVRAVRSGQSSQE